jgi:hypothetical protein
MSASKPVVLAIPEWKPSSIKYMPPKVNEKGGKSINLISTQTNRSIHISTPLMMTWGISDFVNDNGESDGKYSIQLNFPNSEYTSAESEQFLQKLKDFENQILDDAVKNSEMWWGDSVSREVAKHTMFPILKYSKNKETKKIDYTKPPSIRAKVPFYKDKWGVEIYDTKRKMLFPCDNEALTPIDFVPKLSKIACVLQCGGIWIGGKGWGVTWKLIQCVVKPNEVVSVYGQCHVQLSTDELNMIDKQEIKEDVVIPDDELLHSTELSVPQSAASTVPNTVVEDSDEETEVQTPVPEAKVEEKPVVKKVVKKATAAPEVAAPASAEESQPAEAKKKTVVKKKAVA